MERLAMETENITDKNIQKILELFPNVATEGVNDNGEIVRAIDFNKLKQELSEDIVDGQETYDFTWVGKREAMIEANRPIRKTLRPDRESSVNWDTTENIYIEGDNLDALKLLQESYMGKIKMIYIDPPYNTGKDFVYRDNFTQDKESYEEELGIKDENNNKLFQNTEANGRFHSDWCSMIYPRLKLARNLLSDDGVIFISIDDNEVDNLRKICDEVFGNENFVAEFPRVTKRGGKSTGTYAKNHDYIMIYSKNNNEVNISGITHIDEGFRHKDEYFNERGAYKLNQTLDYNTLQYNSTMDFPIEINGKIFVPGGDINLHKQRHNGIHGKHDWVWRWSKQLFDFGYQNGWIVLSNTGRIYTKTYLNASICKDQNGKYYIEYKTRTKPLSTLDFTENIYSNDNSNKEITKLMDVTLFDYVKPTSLILQCMKTILYNKNDIILDFFSGSATTAHACMQLNAEDGGNRKFIMVQLPEVCDEKSEAYKAGYKNICQIGEERIRRAGKKIQEENPDKKIDIGFRVFKVDDTNMKDVYYTPNETAQKQLGMFESNIKDDRTDEDLLYGCLLDWGVELSLPHKVEVIDGKRVHIVNEQEGFEPDLIACFEDSIPESVIRKIAEKKPTRVVFRDSSFVSDDNKINVEEIFKLITPDTKVKVI